MWGVCEVWILLARSYLKLCETLKWRPFTHLGGYYTPSGVNHFHHRSISFSSPTLFNSFPFPPFIHVFILNSCSWFCFCYMLMVHHLVWPWPPLMLTLLSFSFHIAFHLSLYIDFSSLPLWSEPSHLLNHLVKFVSSENLP